MHQFESLKDFQDRRLSLLERISIRLHVLQAIQKTGGLSDMKDSAQMSETIGFFMSKFKKSPAKERDESSPRKSFGMPKRSNVPKGLQSSAEESDSPKTKKHTLLSIMAISLNEDHNPVDEERFFSNLMRDIETLSPLTKSNHVQAYIVEFIYLVEKRYAHFDSISKMYNELTMMNKVKQKEYEDLQGILKSHQEADAELQLK